MPKRRSGLSVPKRSSGVGPRHALDRRGPLTGGGLGRIEHGLGDEAHDVVLAGEGALHVELGELELPVGPQVLVAQAAGDLVVAVEAADHEQLLGQLRALRQRVERAVVQAGGTENSREPSGVGAHSSGVSISAKPWRSMAARMAALTRARRRRLRCMRGRRRST